MPFGDGTGPVGLGPMTGRAAGYCAGYPMPGCANPNPVFGRLGFGQGRSARGGRGRGNRWRNMYYSTGMPGWARAGHCVPFRWSYGSVPKMSSQEEMEMLKEQATFLKDQMDSIQNRIDNLEKETVDEK